MANFYQIAQLRHESVVYLQPNLIKQTCERPPVILAKELASARLVMWRQLAIGTASGSHPRFSTAQSTSLSLAERLVSRIR